ncbi:SLATT domain-containing protein [Vibrio sp. M260112]|uniref:SLATT domain-containing protein n=1 Tax=Vibrio sp. M260112 TaxID=3020895 RepID=UPI002F3FFFB5
MELEKNTPAQALLEQINQNIVTLKPKVKKQKLYNQVVTALSIVLGAAITFILGLKVTGSEDALKNTALGLGALLTIVNGWSAAFDYRKLWVRQKSTLLDLYNLKNQLVFQISVDHTSQEALNDIFDRYQEIWERDGNDWRSTIYKNQTNLKPKSAEKEQEQQ